MKYILNISFGICYNKELYKKDYNIIIIIKNTYKLLMMEKYCKIVR